MLKLLFSAAALFGFLTYLSAQTRLTGDGFPVRVAVAGGQLEGIYSTKTGVKRFLGVPFAAPPTGDRRWRAPQPADRWEGVRMAKQFGPRAVQKFLFADMRFRSEMSEDCLYLNVWAPAEATANKSELPILLYFHGGGNMAGSGDELRYDGEYLAGQGIIFITANYRLEAFGYLAHPELSDEADHGSGNYGLLDQVAALDWVRANAAAFGGDPDRITIGGESAGSIDCSILMASPLSRDKLAGVFGQSGSALNGGMRPVPLAEAEATGETFLERTGYASIAELRQAPTEVIYAATYAPSPLDFQMTVDGHAVPEQPADTYAAGRQAQVPLMVGWTSAETAWLPPPASAEVFANTTRQQFGDQAEAILGRYPADEHFAESHMALMSDTWIVLGTWMWADAHARTASAPVYRYRFDRIRPPLKGESREREPLGAGHATDIEYFLNTLGPSDAYAWEAADQQTAAHASRLLVNFVKRGDPNGPEATAPWRRVTAGEAAPVMHLDSTLTVRPAAQDDRYRLLRRLAKE